MDKYSDSITSLVIDSIAGQTNILIEWREQFLVLNLQIFKDSFGFYKFVKEDSGQLYLSSERYKEWEPLENMNRYNRPILDSIYSQKHRIRFCYNLMTKYPIKQVFYNAKYKMAVIDFDLTFFYNIADPLFFEEDNGLGTDFKHIQDDWWFKVYKPVVH